MLRRLDLDALQQHLAGTPLLDWASDLPGQIDRKLALGHGDLQRWMVRSRLCLPCLRSRSNLPKAFAGNGPCTPAQQEALLAALQGLIPWRKGPFNLFGVHVDSEWRSDWKWQRVAPHLDLRGKRILDVGCGNGYYLWRMLGAGASSAVGIDPNWLFLCQFLAAKLYLPDLPAWHLPLALEELPGKLEGFDTVFSMGVLYHRRSPIDHLLELRNAWSKGRRTGAGNPGRRR
jgi:tRNA (mo5U34)-methyltransferase